MTATEFQINYGPELKKFFETPVGKEFITLLNGLRPGYEFPVHDHLLIENRGMVRGYELCLRNIIGLTMPPKVTSQPEANYGVPDRKPIEGKTETK